VLQNLDLSLTRIDAEVSLSLAVAEVNMRSQQAALSLSLQPFTVRIDLPIASSSY
jgi:hypothetical protein